MMNPKQKVFLVDWIDSCGQEGWISKDNLQVHATMCQTIGFLVGETDEAIALALNRSTMGEGYRPYGEIICIPKVAIKKMRQLKVDL